MYVSNSVDLKNSKYVSELADFYLDIENLESKIEKMNNMKFKNDRQKFIIQQEIKRYNNKLFVIREKIADIEQKMELEKEKIC